MIILSANAQNVEILDYNQFYPITAIYMGNKITKRNSNYIIDLCKRLNIDCYYMQRNLFNYELHPKKITN